MAFALDPRVLLGNTVAPRGGALPQPGVDAAARAAMLARATGGGGFVNPRTGQALGGGAQGFSGGGITFGPGFVRGSFTDPESVMAQVAMAQPRYAGNPAAQAQLAMLANQAWKWGEMASARQEAIDAGRYVPGAVRAAQAAAAAAAAAPPVGPYGYQTANEAAGISNVGTGPGQSPYAGQSAYQTPAAAAAGIPAGQVGTAAYPNARGQRPGRPTLGLPGPRVNEVVQLPGGRGMTVVTPGTPGSRPFDYGGQTYYGVPTNLNYLPVGRY